MKLGNPINVRLPIAKQLIYEAEATARNLPLSVYLRQKLEAADNVKSATAASSGEVNQSVMLEMLLLLRQIAQPQKMQLAQSELRRLGFNIWDGKEDKGNESI